MSEEMMNGMDSTSSSAPRHDENGVPVEKRARTESSNEGRDGLVPQLNGVTEGDLSVAARVLESVASLAKKENGLELYRQQNLRPFRKALASCLELHKKVMFNGKAEEQYYEERKKERSLKRQKMAESKQQQKYIAETTLRKGRVERLQKLQQESKQEEVNRHMAMLVPDGHVETKTTVLNLLENGQAEEIEEAEVAAADNGGETGNEEEANIRLPKLRSCYVCKIRYRDLHPFYDQLCPTCAPFNWTKRHQTADLTGRVAVVTGSRVKIGYQTCLKLLRAGCTVVATTRFPNSAAATYRQEDDFDSWKNRLHIYGLDLRDVTGLEAFTRFLKMRYMQGIDILINNACQTVRRPRGYYVPMMEKEQSLWTDGDEIHKTLLGGCAEFENVRRKLFLDHKEETAPEGKNAPLLQMAMANTSGEQNEDASKELVSLSTSSSNQVTIVSNTPAPFETTGVSHSAAMSQMVILPEDVGVADSVLPPGASDVNGQQLDLRTTNSWLLKMEEVSTPEIMECMFINAIAPFVLNSRLKPLMTAPHTNERPDRYIINVSAMEGKFYRYKMPNHPHTNMAKAALNMMTRTSAEDLAKKHRIYMNSVDTGWINDENPLEKASKIAKTNLFQTPIDEIDAAARILDPIFSGVNGGRDSEKEYGKFLKDYRETEW